MPHSKPNEQKLNNVLQHKTKKQKISKQFDFYLLTKKKLWYYFKYKIVAAHKRPSTHVSLSINFHFNNFQLTIKPKRQRKTPKWFLVWLCMCMWCCCCFFVCCCNAIYTLCVCMFRAKRIESNSVQNTTLKPHRYIPMQAANRLYSYA